MAEEADRDPLAWMDDWIAIAAGWYEEWRSEFEATIRHATQSEEWQDARETERDVRNAGAVL